MNEQHKLKMVVDYDAGIVHAQRAAELYRLEPALLGISKRQFRRLVTAYRKRGIENPTASNGICGSCPATRAC
ncbi:MAG: hypothetical protein U1B80_10145 [Anaerolineaceae bacterium]|nr:hypothetical protein [Anaerolineaceae bacterium]